MIDTTLTPTRVTILNPKTRCPVLGCNPMIQQITISQQKSNTPQDKKAVPADDSSQNQPKEITSVTPPSEAKNEEISSNSIEEMKSSKAASLLPLLPNNTVATINQWPLNGTLSSDQLSPQTQAFQWTIRDPNFESLEPWQLVENSALVCFYYATGGDTSWNESNNWLSYNREAFPWLIHKNLVGNYWIPKSVFVAWLGGQESEELLNLWLQVNGLKGSLSLAILF
ncbi:hypothetical protein SEMRO_611_G175320.1 [Seminavis robusta]|uniref:Uncharacterized protein n=1 Tax=Seminavis robusta TaxID=568900 RepID=A0A9N8E3E5_9STRA|nr:hypothetical protein SEMRO_611_G175320.1 [Seminavis robusta]|eukprot:Sro611_g175320.1 n/a (226) ;mRNA; r:22991-23668